MGDDHYRAITNLLVDYAHAIDSDRVEEWPDFFTEDGRYTILPRTSFEKGYVVGVMNCETTGMMRDRVSAYRRANIYEPHRYRHVVGNPRITLEQGGVFNTETSYAVFRTMQDGSTDIFSSGEYRDEILFQGTRPRLRSRLVLCDSHRIDTLIVIPI